MELLRKMMLFALFILVGSLASGYMFKNIGIGDLIYGLIFAVIISIVRPDVFKLKKKLA